METYSNKLEEAGDDPFLICHGGRNSRTLKEAGKIVIKSNLFSTISLDNTASTSYYTNKTTPRVS